MKPLAVARIYVWSCLAAFLVSGTAAIGQSPESGQRDSQGTHDVRQPLLHLPPIVNDSGQSQNDQVKPVKELFLPPIVSHSENSQQPASQASARRPVKQLFLPPIVSRGENPTPVPMTTAATTAPNAAAAPGTGQMPPSSNANAAAFNRALEAPRVPLYTAEQQAVLRQTLDQAMRAKRVDTASFNQSGQGEPPIIGGEGNMPELPPVVLPDLTTEARPQARVASGRVNQEVPIVNPQDAVAPDAAPSGVPDFQVESPAPVFDPAPPASVPAGGIPAGGVPANGVPGTNDYFATPTTEPGVTSGASGAGGCPTCGPDGCYDLDQVQAQMGCCGPVVSAGYYVFADFIAFSRGGDSGDVQLSNFAGLNDFGIAGGVRVTLGYRRNATTGRELTYWGTGKIGESVLEEDPTNGLFPTFTAGGGFNFGDISSFFNAQTHFQSKSTQFHNIELNRVEWTWDLFKTMVGFRYLLFRDDVLFWSANPVSNGLFTMNSYNNLFGLNLGYELFYDVGYRTSFSFTNRFAGYINAAKYDTNLFNANQFVLDQETTQSTFASSVDFSLMAHFQVAPRARLRASADVLLLWGVYTVENNVPRTTTSNGVVTGTPIITPQTGTMLNTTNQPVFFNGFSFGFEFFR